MTIGAPIYYPADPIAIRDGTAARLEAMPGLNKVFKARTSPTKDDALPYAIVWNAGSRTQPNGDSNVGAPSFLHTMTLIVDVMTKAGNDANLDAEIVGLVEMAMATLMTDPTWIALFEGIERCDTRYSYPKEAADILVQGMIEFEVTVRSEWPPFVPNDLKQVTIFAKPARAPVTCRYCGTPNEGPRTSCRVCSAALPQPSDPIITTLSLPS